MTPASTHTSSTHTAPTHTSQTRVVTWLRWAYAVAATIAVVTTTSGHLGCGNNFAGGYGGYGNVTVA